MFYKSTHFLQLRVFVAEQRLEAIAADHDFQQTETFAIDSFFFYCLPPSNIKETSPQLILCRNTLLDFINQASAEYDAYAYCLTIFIKIVGFNSKYYCNS